MEQLDFEVLVPGHGKIGRKDHVRLFRGYLEDLRAAVLEHVKQGRSLEETKAGRAASEIRAVAALCRLVSGERGRDVSLSVADEALRSLNS